MLIFEKMSSGVKTGIENVTEWAIFYVFIFNSATKGRFSNFSIYNHLIKNAMLRFLPPALAEEVILSVPCGCLSTFSSIPVQVDDYNKLRQLTRPALNDDDSESICSWESDMTDNQDSN